MDRSPITVVIWVVAALLALVAGARLVVGEGEAHQGTPIRLAGSAADERGSGGHQRVGAGPLAYVHVAGAVRAPGLYQVAPGARVAAVLQRAGGPAPRADLAGVNLAARVQDGQQIVVPRAGPAGDEGGGEAVVKPSLGSATAEQLDALDGLGPTLAQRIVDYRQAHGGFRSVSELAEVEGIGEKRLEALRLALQP